MKRATEYDSFEALPDHEDTVAIGGDLGESRDELLATLREIYPPEKDKLGALAIQIERARATRGSRQEIDTVFAGLSLTPARRRWNKRPETHNDASGAPVVGFQVRIYPP